MGNDCGTRASYASACRWRSFVTLRGCIGASTEVEEGEQNDIVGSIKR